jgi:hypothetical protein
MVATKAATAMQQAGTAVARLVGAQATATTGILMEVGVAAGLEVLATVAETEAVVEMPMPAIRGMVAAMAPPEGVPAAATAMAEAEATQITAVMVARVAEPAKATAPAAVMAPVEAAGSEAASEVAGALAEVSEAALATPAVAAAAAAVEQEAKAITPVARGEMPAA